GTLTTGCVVYEHDDHVYVPPPSPAVNRAPYVIDTEAGCYWDDYYYDDIWYFDAVVGDPDSVWDVASVWADVYDLNRGDRLVETFELYPTNDPAVWFSEWLGSTTYLDCFYRGYVVDIVVYDQLDAWGVSTTTPYTY